MEKKPFYMNLSSKWERFLICYFFFIGFTLQTNEAESASPPTYTYRIIKEYPHDRRAYTQGLVVENNILYESTGRYGESTLRKVNLETGQVLKIHKLSKKYFAEGMTLFQNKLIQLTWKSQVGYVYDKERFSVIHQFYYPTEGWGLTHDSTHLIMSDGTATLYFLHPDTFETVKSLKIHDDSGPVIRLNELEYIRGEIWANIWGTDRISKIDPNTGAVTGWIDLKGLKKENPPYQVDVLNGIAYAPGEDRLFVTGKWWPRLYEIEIILSK